MKPTQNLQQFLQKIIEVKDKQISLLLEPVSDDRQARFEALKDKLLEVENEMFAYMSDDMGKSDMFLEHEGTKFYFYDVQNFKNAIEVRCTNPEHFEQFAYDVADLIVH